MHALVKNENIFEIRQQQSDSLSAGHKPQVKVPLNFERQVLCFGSSWLTNLLVATLSYFVQ